MPSDLVSHHKLPWMLLLPKGRAGRIHQLFTSATSTGHTHYSPQPQALDICTQVMRQWDRTPSVKGSRDHQTEKPVNTHTHTHNRTCTHIHTYTHIHTSAHTYTHIYTHAHPHAHIHTHKHTYTPTCTHSHTYAHMHITQLGSHKSLE